MRIPIDDFAARMLVARPSDEDAQAAILEKDKPSMLVGRTRVAVEKKDAKPGSLRNMTGDPDTP